MPIKNLTLGACLLITSVALAQNHHNTHIVRKGETLAKIAKWVGVSKERLVAANHLNGKAIKPGFVLHIPAPQASHTATPHLNLALGGFAPYTLAKNENDWKVASMFHMTPKSVRALNPHVDWNHVKAGSKIRIPMRNAFVYRLARIPVIRSRYAVTVKSDVVVRSAPGVNAHRITKVDSGRHVRVLDRDDHWYKVRFEQGTEGWVRGDLLKSETPHILASAPIHHSKPAMRLAVHETKRHAEKPIHLASRTVRASRESRHVASNYRLPAAGESMLAYAQSFKNTPYRYGQSSRSGTDCSGFSLQVLRHEGVHMPRTAAEQSQKGVHVDRGSLKPGDLIFFHTGRGSRVSHVGIYMGGDKFIHASSGGGKVQVNSLSEGYYHNRFATARRVVKVKSSESKKDSISQSHNDDEKAMKAAEKTMKKSD